MNDKHTRALRRFHRERKYKHTRKVMLKWYNFYLKGYYARDGWREPQLSEEEFHIRICLHRDNLAICSCYGCCNVRRCKWNQGISKLTIQERKELDNAADGMKEAVELLHDRQYSEDIE